MTQHKHVVEAPVEFEEGTRTAAAYKGWDTRRRREAALDALLEADCLAGWRRSLMTW